MTIRDLLTRKATELALLVLALSMTAVALVLTFGEALGPPVILGLATLLIGLPFGLLYKLFRCPSCNSSLASLVGQFGPMRWLAKKVDYCPYCGVQLDSSVAP